MFVGAEETVLLHLHGPSLYFTLPLLGQHSPRVFSLGVCVRVCVSEGQQALPARAPSVELLFDGKSHASENPDSCCASCSALASTWVWLASLRICFDCYITQHFVLCAPYPVFTPTPPPHHPTFAQSTLHLHHPLPSVMLLPFPTLFLP